MEKNNKIDRRDFVDVYIIETLNEIKNDIKRNIKLEKNREEEIDKKMSLVLKNLINSNFKNLQVDVHGNLIYTMLPIVDEKENKKVRLSLVLYYTALYYDNIDLLHELLKANIRFEEDYRINLQYLDCSISSKYETGEYITKIKTCGKIFVNFVRSIQNLSTEEKEKYIERFIRLLNEKFDMINNKLSENDPYGFNRRMFQHSFDKNCLDTFTDKTYRCATVEQLNLIDHCYDEKYENKTIERLNKIMQTKGYSTYLYNCDLMMKLFNDEEIEKLNSAISSAIKCFSQTEESLKKILDFIQMRPELARNIQCIPEDIFMKTDNYTLIEVCENYRVYSDDIDLNLVIKVEKPKATLKRVFGAYKKRNAQE